MSPKCTLSMSIALVLLTLLPAAIAYSCPTMCSCSKNFKRVDCEHKQLRQIPAGIPATVTGLYLGFNLLVGLPENAFSSLVNLEQLSLKNNELLSANIHPNAFTKLQNLKYLFLTGNRLSNISKELFHDLQSLQRIYLTQNILQEIPDLGYCVNLVRLGLDNNKLTAARFPEGFKMLLELSTLDLNNNPLITNFTKDDVKYLTNSNIRTIKLARCNLKIVDVGAFQSFKYLQSLSLSYNKDLSMESIKNVINSLQYSQLTDLDLSYSVQGALIPRDMFHNFSNVPLRTLTMSHMRNANVIQNGTFTSLKKLFVLDLSYCALDFIEEGAFDAYGSSLQQLNLFSNNLKAIPKGLPTSLIYLDMSNNGGIKQIGAEPFAQLDSLQTLNFDNCMIREVDNNAFTGLVNLNSLNLAHNVMPGSAMGVEVLRHLLNLQRLNLQGNKITQIETEKDLFLNLANLTELDLSKQKNGGCSVLNPHIFSPLKSLEILDLSDNDLGGTIEQDDGALFQGLFNLQKLHLEMNNIHNLPPNLIDDLIRLKFLNLTSNKISFWEETFFNKTQALETVDFSNNDITLVNSSSVSSLPRNVNMNLSSNPFNCWCGLIWFRHWMDEVKNTSEVVLFGASNYTCYSPKEMYGKKVKSFQPDSILEQCFPPPWKLIIIITGASAAALISIVGSVMYRYRWKLKLKWYYFQKSLSHGKSSQPGYDPLSGEDNEEIYDVCISYGPSDHDSRWVDKQLVPKLTTENQHKIFFDKYILPNEPDIGCIADALQKSRKILLVVSKEYINDSRRDYEVELALSFCEESNQRIQERVIVILMGEKIDMRIPAKIQPLISEDHHLVWPDYDNEGQELFWNELDERLGQNMSPSSNIQV